MTLSEIESLDKDFLVAEDVADYIGCNPQEIRLQAQKQAETGVDKLGFPVVIIGTRVRIPKAAFISYMKYGRVVVGL